MRAVPVAGGELAVAVYGPEDPDAPTILAVHGITSSSRAWIALAAALPEVRIIAPDLRGRGRSAGLPAPYGLPQHAADLEGVLDAFGLGRAVVVGHSMGAFVSVLLADLAPERVAELVLVDGGVPLPAPEGADVDGAIAATLGPAAERLSMSFESVEAYRGFWRSHPAFAEWTAGVQAYVDYDLVERGGRLSPAAHYAAVAADVPGLFGPDWYLAALGRLSMPVVVLRAPRGLLDEPGGLYAPGVLDRVLEAMPTATLVEVPDVNHYTIVMTEPGSGIVAERVRAALAAQEAGR